MEIDAILEVLARLPAELVAPELEALAADPRFSWRLRSKLHGAAAQAEA